MVDIKTWRHNLSLSQSQMAEFLNVPLSTYRKWEQGTHSLTDAMISWVELLQYMETSDATGRQLFRMRLERLRQGSGEASSRA